MPAEKPQTPFTDDAVGAVFAGYPDPARMRLLALRDMIFETAAETPAVGRVEETLKWGQPAYLTPDSKSGSTLRLGIPKSGGYAIFAHCQTSIISDFAQLFPGEFRFDGNRGALFRDDEAPDPRLRLLIRSGLTYHLKPRD